VSDKAQVQGRLMTASASIGIGTLQANNGANCPVSRHVLYSARIHPVNSSVPVRGQALPP
jgi:hypothetical protein